jgi:FlaA1/EpsC-like NDP-sugar epimerase
LTDSWGTLLDRPEFVLPAGQLESVVGGKTVLLTGAAGTVGQALTRLVLKGLPAKVILLDSHEASLVRLAAMFPADRHQSVEVHCLLADVRDGAKISQVFQRFAPDVVFHLAAYKQVPLAESNLDQVVGVNLLGTASVVEASIANGVTTIAYPSTDKAVYPHGVYGTTKRLVERYLASLASDSRLAIRVVRLVNVLGSQGSVAEIFARQIEAGQPIWITDVRMDRYWMTLAEAIHLLIAAVARPAYEGAYLLDVGEPVPLMETARRIYRNFRNDHGEPEIQTIGIRPGERLHEPLQYDAEIRRETGVPGLFSLEAPPGPDNRESWRQTIQDLRERLYHMSTTELRDWAFAAASADYLPAVPDSPR